MSAIHYIARPWLTRGATTVGYEVDGIFQSIAECSGFGHSTEEAERTAAQIAAALNGCAALAASHQRLKEALTYCENVMTYTQATVSPCNSTRRDDGEWVRVHGGRARSSYRQLVAALDCAREALKDAP